VSRPRGEPLRGHTGEVMAVALGEVDGEPVVVSGSGEKLWHEGFDALARALRGISDDNTVRLWDAHSHSLLRIVPLRSEVTGLAMGKDSAIAVSAHNGLLVLDF